MFPGCCFISVGIVVGYISSQSSDSGGYDADQDSGSINSPTTTTSSSPSMEIYDFDQSDDVRLRLELSPERPAPKRPSRPSKGSSSGRKKSLQIEQKGNKKRTVPTPKISPVKKMSKSKSGSGSDRRGKKSSDSSVLLNKKNAATVKELKASPTGKGRKTRVDYREVSKPSLVEQKRDSLKSSTCTDSGVFMTPPSLLKSDLHDSSVSLKSAQKSSTPSSQMAAPSHPVTQSVNRDSRHAPSPMLSPVEKVITPGVSGKFVTSQIEFFEDSEFQSLTFNNSPRTYSKGHTPGKSAVITYRKGFACGKSAMITGLRACDR